VSNHVILMVDPASITIAVLSLAISATTAWLTLFRRGAVRMTQPTVIYFGPEKPHSRDSGPWPKVYLRTLLFSTSRRGRVIESMHVTLARNETRQTFNVWVHGDEKLVRGSGLFVGESGVAANHQFLTPRDGSTFQFSPGRYHLDVYARLLGDAAPTLLFSQQLEVSNEIAQALLKPATGVYFDWGPDSSRYLPHVDKRLPSPDPTELIEALGFAMRSGPPPENTPNPPTPPSS
jgi:hypothetical protein